MNSLRGRVRLLTMGLTLAFGLASLLAVSCLRILERSVTEVLSRNYRSIEAAQGIAQAIAGLQLVARDGSCPEACPALRSEFERWLAVEHGNYTEPGEPELAHAIDAGGHALFEAVMAGGATEQIDAAAHALREDVRTLIALNRSAMFDADRHTRLLANRLMLSALGVLAALTVIVGALAWTLSSAVAKPLHELADRLRAVNPRSAYPTLGKQPLAELEAVAQEYRKMARRLEGFERMNIAALHEEQAKIEAVIESIDDGLIMIDANDVVAHVNEVACAILGLERAQMLGTRFDALSTQQPHYVRIREAVREFMAGPGPERERIELTLFLRGRDHHYVLRPIPFQTRDGLAAGLILVLQDVTYLRDQAARREHLVATLAHELGSPLTSLRMALELLLRDAEELPAAQRPLLDAAQEDVGRLQDVAQRLLDLSRAQATSIALERKNVDLGEVIDRMIRIFTPQARDKGVALDAAMPVAGLTISGDPTKLTWALSNLLSNALRYTPAQGHVRIAAATGTQSVLVAVSDTGPGIPPEQRERIFERFVQSADGGAIGAAGLGLAIVRDIVQAHGGRIRLDSDIGRGSCFTLELPRG